MLKALVKTPVSILSKYNNALLKAPYKTKMATAGFTYFVADCICQNYIEKKAPEDYSPTRSLRQASVGAFFAAPSLHVWHSLILPKVVFGLKSPFTKVILSVFLNETVLAGYFVSCLLFSFESLKMMSAEAGAENVKEKFVPAMKASMKFWTGISLINYAFMPIHLRPVFVSCWSVVWQSYLSYVSNNAMNTKTEEVMTPEEVNVALNYKFLINNKKALAYLG